MLWGDNALDQLRRGAGSAPSTSSASDEARGAPWRAVFVLLGFYALAMVDRQIVYLLVGPIRTDLGVSDFQVGLLQGLSFALSYCLFGLPFGYAADRFSRRMVILVGVLVWAAATTASGFAASFGWLFAARIFVGAGEAALGPAVFSMLSDLFPPNKLTFALSIYSIGALVGSAVALALGGWLVGFAGANAGAMMGFKVWQAVFILVGVPGMFAAFLIFLIPEPRRRSRSTEGSWGDLFRFMAARRAFFVSHLGGFSCIMTIAYAHLTWTPTFLVRHFGWTIPQVGATLAVYSLATGAVCFLISGKVVELMERRGFTDAHFRFYVAGSLIVALAGAVAYQLPTPVLYLSVALFAALFLNLAAIAPAALQVVTPPELRGRVSAVYLLVAGAIGMTLGPAMVSGITRFILQDDKAVGVSLSATFLIMGLIGCAFFAFGLRPMREARRAMNASLAD